MSSDKLRPLTGPPHDAGFLSTEIKRQRSRLDVAGKQRRERRPELRDVVIDHTWETENDRRSQFHVTHCVPMSTRITDNSSRQDLRSTRHDTRVFTTHAVVIAQRLYLKASTPNPSHY